MVDCLHFSSEIFINTKQQEIHTQCFLLYMFSTYNINKYSSNQIEVRSSLRECLQNGMDLLSYSSQCKLELFLKEAHKRKSMKQ